ncbi:MAG: hypothetical protein M3388_04905 [Acidobacteriota bacterium]|nr:hypothetical protein [Acidobacteriota bacterium]
MDCCCSGAKMTKETPQNACGECGEVGRDVARKTVVHHVKSEKLSCVETDKYKFCPSSNCPVVYYSAAGRVFRVEDVRESVTAKASGENRPLCYCFGFTEGDVRREIAEKGESTVPAQISQFIKEKLCVCEIRNPAGACCLGEINRTVKNLSLARLSQT